MNTQAAPKRGRRLFPLIALIIVFAAPAVAAWFFYLNPEYLPTGRSNLGELIDPVVPLNDSLGLKDTQGAPLDLGPFADKWTLVSLNSSPCEQPCRDRLISLRQIRLALGETSRHVERLRIDVTSGPAPAVTDEFEGMYSAVAGEALLDALGTGEAALDRIYILDPMGNLMMRYAPDASPKDTLKDMERLLKASKNWLKGASYGHR